jgi:hypothetical protein
MRRVADLPFLPAQRRRGRCGNAAFPPKFFRPVSLAGCESREGREECEETGHTQFFLRSLRGLRAKPVRKKSAFLCEICGPDLKLEFGKSATAGSGPIAFGKAIKRNVEIFFAQSI